MKQSVKSIQRILIANRGEIAVRILKTIQEMGLTAITVHSTPDARLPHAILADESYHLPGETPLDTYLQTEHLIELCRKHHIDAVHPGYGFLSENAAFAKACQKAGIIFIGPNPEVIEEMGDKIRAKAVMVKAGVPVVPGWSGDPETPMTKLQAAADKIGYPILVKAAAGGGGKGMRQVHDPTELAAAIEAARREAQNAFKDSRIFLEKYVTEPRHIEFQIMGDEHGQVIQLFERECSIQRRHQKIIEESPSPFLDDALRGKMTEAALNAAKALNYTNAGTVEFIVDSQKNFYFLEINTRLQVEHPVTEMTTGLDLVRLQIEVAQGKPLDPTLSQLTQRGHAIECRLYAEDPDHQFLPSIGQLKVYQPPTGPNIRVDNGFKEGDSVTVYYDPMLAKLIVWDTQRSAALQKMQWALKHFAVLGVTTNLGFLQSVVAHPAFARGETHTHFLSQHADDLGPHMRKEASEQIFALGATMMALIPNTLSQNKKGATSPVDLTGLQGPWTSGQNLSMPWQSASTQALPNNAEAPSKSKKAVAR